MKTISSFIFNLTARVLFTIVSVISGFYLVRYLGANQYGIISIYTNLLGFISVIISFSLIDSYGKEIAMNGISNKIVSESITVIGIIGLITIILISGTMSLIDKYIEINLGFWIYILLAVHILFYLLQGLFEKILESIGKPQIFSSVQFLTGFITILSVFFTIWFRLNFILYLICQAAIPVVSLIIYVIYFHKKAIFSGYKISFNPESFKRIFKYGFSIHVANLFFTISQKIPVFITQKFYGSSFVSFLNVPVNLYGRLYLPVYSLCNVISPKFSNGDKASNSKNFIYGLKLILVLFISSMAFFIAGSYKLIPILYSHGFSEAAIPAMILAPFLLFNAINLFFTSVINYLGIAGQRLKFILFSGIIDIIVIALFTKFFGFYGLVSSISVSIIILTCFDFYIIQKKIEVPIKEVVIDIAKILFSTLPIFIFCFYFSGLSSIPYLAGCMAAGLLYLALILAVKVISLEDIKSLISSFKGRKK